MSCFQTEIRSADVPFFHRAFIKPLQLSSGPISDITETRAQVRVRVNRQEAESIRSIYLSNLWAWPGPSISHDERNHQLRAALRAPAATLDAWWIVGAKDDGPRHCLRSTSI